MSQTLLEVKDVCTYFKTPRGMLHAVDGVSFTIQKGKTLGIVGESGCGKSTLGRTVLHLVSRTSGSIFFDGDDITNASGVQLKNLRRKMQIIFQDPFASLNPRKSVRKIIEEPLIIYRLFSSKAEREKRVSELMETVGLAERLSNMYPHELDGGRRQRIGIARALALKPEFIVCDEPVSALDVSIQAQIINLMQDLQKELNLTYIFITHDFSVVRHISDEICVMYLGQLIEKAAKDELFTNPVHPYTQALLSAIPVPVYNKKRKRIILNGEISSPIEPKPGCRFAPRCIYACDVCRTQTPDLREVSQNHQCACHFWDNLHKET